MFELNELNLCESKSAPPEGYEYLVFCRIWNINDGDTNIRDHTRCAISPIRDVRS